MAAHDTVNLLRQDLIAHAKSISVMTERIADLEEFKAEMKLDLVRRDARAERMAEQINAIYNLGKWVLVTFGALLLAALSRFMISGGLSVGP